MKKAFAIALTLLMVFTLFACNAPADSGTPSASSEPSSAAPSSAAPSSEAPATETPAATTDDSGKFVIPTVDFRAPTDPFSRDTYKIVDLNIAQTPIGAFMDDCYTQLGTKLNYEFTALTFNADIDLFMTNIETCAGQGYDGMIIQGDYTTEDRILEIVDEYDINFIPGMSPFVDDNNNYIMSAVVMGQLHFAATRCSSWSTTSANTLTAPWISRISALSPSPSPPSRTSTPAWRARRLSTPSSSRPSRHELLCLRHGQRRRQRRHGPGRLRPGRGHCLRASRNEGLDSIWRH
jgi:hypothetical protein